MWLLLAFAVTAGTFRRPDDFASSYDWRLFETWLEAGRRSVLWYHQFPLWNPWTCGGQVYLANPQSLVATPTFPLVLLFGTALGAKLTLVVYYFCAFDGMYRLARSFDISVVSSMLAAILFGTGGWLALHFAEGHCTFFGAALFPYAMYFYRRACDDGEGAERPSDLIGVSASPVGRRLPAQMRWEWAIPLGFIAAWIVGDGGTSTPPMCAVILTTLALIDCVQRRSARPFLPLALAAGIAFAVGAIRVLPALEFAVDHPRHLFETDANFPWQMVRNAYWWKGIEPVPGKRYWFHEYGWRLPYLTVPLWIWAIGVRKARVVWIFVAVGAAIVAGSAWPYGPWWLLHHLPIFRDLRVPSRYQIMLAIGVPLLCAMALDDLRARAWWHKERWKTVFTVAVLAICAVDGLWFDWVRYSKTFDMHWSLAQEGTSFYQVVGEWRSMMSNVFENHGAIGCDEEAPLQRALKLDEGPGPQARIEDPAPGSVDAIRWTPNRVEVDVDLRASAVVSVNENWNEHWKVELVGDSRRAERGEIIRVGPRLARDRDGGRLGARVPAGHYTVAFIYRPASFVYGILLTALSIPLALAAWILARRGRRRAAPRR
ncbi:MAG TPA: hypothetical protein VN947_36175 [Polyangia bacterium]|nr:hypothetical protein [Polyangia bacterium]